MRPVIAVLFLVLPVAAFAQQLQLGPPTGRQITSDKAMVGKVVALGGDTLLMEGQTRIRLWGINAPGIDTWPMGPKARAELDKILRNSYLVLCEAHQKSHEEALAQCWLWSDGMASLGNGGYYLPLAKATSHDIGQMMISTGYAVEHRAHTGGWSPYTESENTARNRKVGIWRD